MPQDIEVGYVPYMLSADYLATIGADFNSEAIDDAILREVNRLAPRGISVHRNGKAFAAPEAAEAGRSVNWGDLLKEVHVDQIVADNGR